ncbi:M16 family metallopeptidase, partial [Sphingomonas bacterium]|uniref:M16 family metallopeptidase n=1 Tax=Sphingomonas bacterium TaxID=1895847 RepID=UPI001576F332
MNRMTWWLGASASLFAAAAMAQVPQKRPGVWAQSYSGRKADPAIRFGTLPNGMRYAVMHNATPPGQMSLRLYIGSGSIAEEDDQQGLAHFLEHMAFRGSTHVPDGEMMRVLQRHGLAFGADTNASTGQTATTYQFDFPRSDADSIDTGLGFFREIASELTLSQTSMDSERGVILSEERLRDSPGYHAVKAQLGFDLEGQRAPTRWPIGLVDVIKTAQAPRLRAYYEAHYRPDNAVVVAIGDFDADQMEARIRTRFADWRPKTPAGPPIDYGAVKARTEQVRAFAEAGAPERTLVTWARAYDARADTDTREREDFVRLVAITMLNQRYTDLSRRPDPPFLGASFGQGNVLKSANLTNLGLNAAPEKRLAALKVVVDEQRRAMRFGFTRAELDRALTTLLAEFASAAAGNDTRKTTDIVDNLLDNIDEDEVATSPVQDEAQVRAWARTVTPDEAQAALGRAFAGSGPLVFVAAQQAPAGGEAAV